MNGPTPSVEMEHVAWADPRAIALRQAMDVDISDRYNLGEPTNAAVEAEINRVLAVDPTEVVVTVLITVDGQPVAHGALRRHGDEFEVKKVIVLSEHRGRGLGRRLMDEMIRVAREEGAPRVILQTGDRQPEAVALYERLGFTPIPVYEPYGAVLPESLCYELVV